MTSFIKQLPGQVSSLIPGLKNITGGMSNGSSSPERSVSPLSSSPPKQDHVQKPWIDRLNDSIETNNLRAFAKLLTDAPYADYCLESVFYGQIVEVTNYLIMRASITFLDRLVAKWPDVLNTENIFKNIVFTGNCNMVTWYINKPGAKLAVQDAMLLELGTPHKWPEFNYISLIRHCFDQKSNKEFQEIAKYLLDILFEHPTFPQDGYACALGYSRLVRLAINYPTESSQVHQPAEIINTEMVIWLTKYYNAKFGCAP